MGKGAGACLLSLVDRSSRVTLAAKLPRGTADATHDALLSTGQLAAGQSEKHRAGSRG